MAFFLPVFEGLEAGATAAETSIASTSAALEGGEAAAGFTRAAETSEAWETGSDLYDDLGDVFSSSPYSRPVSTSSYRSIGELFRNANFQFKPPSTPAELTMRGGEQELFSVMKGTTEYADAEVTADLEEVKDPLLDRDTLREGIVSAAGYFGKGLAFAGGLAAVSAINTAINPVSNQASLKNQLDQIKLTQNLMFNNKKAMLDFKMQQLNKYGLPSYLAFTQTPNSPIFPAAGRNNAAFKPHTNEDVLGKFLPFQTADLLPSLKY